MLKYFIIFILCFLGFCVAQEDIATGFQHSFQVGYGESPGQKSYSGNSSLLSLTYGFVYENLRLQFNYSDMKAIRPNQEFNETENRLFVPQFGYDYNYFGFSLGLMFINKIKGDAPDMFAIPVASIKVGNISRYYFSASFLNEESLPSLSFKLNYKFKNRLSYIKAGTVYLYKDWDYDSEIQISFLHAILFKVRGIYHLKNRRMYYFGSIGIYHVF